MLQKSFSGKFLVLGSLKHIGEVDTFSWTDESLKSLHFDDYKTIILHFDAIPSQLIQTNSESIRVIYKKEQQLELLSTIDATILSNIQWVGHQLCRKDEKDNINVFVITSPINRFNTHLFEHNLFITKEDAITLNMEENNIHSQSFNGSTLVELKFEFFSNLNFSMRIENNISMINANELIKPYFDEFSNYSFIFANEKQHSPMAHTFYNAELAFLQMIKGVDVIVLPHPRMVSPFDTVEIILRKILHLTSDDHLQTPAWIDDYNTNRQLDLIGDISILKNQIDGLKQQIKEKMIEFELLRDFQHVLFAKGEVLRSAVYTIFKSLRVKVEEPDGVLNHDIEVENADYIFVIQVISADGNILDRSVLRQLNQWVEAKEEEIDYSKKVKGIAIVNYECHIDPKFRNELILEEAAKNYVDKLGFIILPSQNLFEIYNLVEAGELGKFEILDIIGSSKGIFKYQQQIENI